MAIELCSPTFPVLSSVAFTIPETVEKAPIGPPVFVGESTDISVLLVKFNSLGEYEMTGGAGVEYVTYSRV